MLDAPEPQVVHRNDSEEVEGLDRDDQERLQSAEPAAAAAAAAAAAQEEGEDWEDDEPPQDEREASDEASEHADDTLAEEYDDETVDDDDEQAQQQVGDLVVVQGVPVSPSEAAASSPARGVPVSEQVHASAFSSAGLPSSPARGVPVSEQVHASAFSSAGLPTAEEPCPTQMVHLTPVSAFVPPTVEAAGAGEADSGEAAGAVGGAYTSDPPGAPPGGHWVRESYCGLTTMCATPPVHASTFGSPPETSPEWQVRNRVGWDRLLASHMLSAALHVRRDGHIRGARRHPLESPVWALDPVGLSL